LKKYDGEFNPEDHGIFEKALDKIKRMASKTKSRADSWEEEFKKAKKTSVFDEEYTYPVDPPKGTAYTSTHASTHTSGARDYFDVDGLKDIWDEVVEARDKSFEDKIMKTEKKGKSVVDLFGEKSRKNIPGKVIDCGKTTGYPFCMVFLFTKDGVKRYCGSLDNICDEVSHLSLCHGVVHYYNYKKVISRRWDLFGNLSQTKYKTKNRYSFSLERVRSGTSCYGKFRDLIGKPKQTKYYLLLYDNETKEVDIIASWRKLPSSFIKEFEEIEESYRGLKIEEIPF
jgi:hypothetical protein